MSSGLRRWVIDAVLFFDRYILPIIFALSLGEQVRFLSQKYTLLTWVWAKVCSGEFQHAYLIFLSLVISKVFFILLYALFIWGLLTRQPLKEKPTQYREVFFPILGTFFYVFYQFLQDIPPEANFYVVPLDRFILFVVIGTVLQIIGFTIALVATVNLRRAFGILVEARGLVTHGLYRWVRHPLYFGYIVLTIGICLVIPRIYQILLSVILITLHIYRAYLEERKVMAAYPAYREYAAHTPFIFPLPWFCRKKKTGI